MRKPGVPRISAIIPTFNRAAMLPDAVASVCEQTLPPSELIIVDDGSTDETAAMLPGLRDAYEIPIRCLSQANKGPAAARNRGIAMAQGDLLAFLDSDDRWHRDKLLKQCGAMAAAPQFLVSHTKEVWYRNGRRVNQKKIHEPLHGDLFARSVRLCCVGMSTVMVRKTLFSRYGWFDETLRCCEDYDLWLRVAAGEKFLLVDAPLTEKRGGREDQVSQQYRVGMDRFRIQALARLLLTVSTLTEVQHRVVCSALRRKCIIYGEGCCKHGRRSEGEYYLQLPNRLGINGERTE